MRNAVLTLALLLAACDSPHPEFMGIRPKVITIAGSTFAVRIRGEKAEAIRTSREMVPKIGEIFPKAAAAIEIASGCPVVANSMKGDAAYMRARIDCGEAGRAFDRGVRKVVFAPGLPGGG